MRPSERTVVCGKEHTSGHYRKGSLASKDSDADTYYAEMFDSIFGILVGIMALLIAATPILFWLLIRGDYKEAYYQMPILFMGMLFSSMACGNTA